MDKKSINPMIEVTLENGNTSLFTKKFRYEKIIDDSETRFQLQLVTASIFWKLGWYPHKALLKLLPSNIIYMARLAVTLVNRVHAFHSLCLNLQIILRKTISTAKGRINLWRYIPIQTGIRKLTLYHKVRRKHKLVKTE